MRTTKEQLRRIIREAVQRKLAAHNERPLKEGRLNNEIVDLVGGALATQLNELFLREGETIESNAREMVLGVPPENVVVPSRYEDLRSFAEACAEFALTEVQDQIHEMAFGILQELMEPVES